MQKMQLFCCGLWQNGARRGSRCPLLVMFSESSLCPLACLFLLARSWTWMAAGRFLFLGKSFACFAGKGCERPTLPSPWAKKCTIAFCSVVLYRPCAAPACVRCFESETKGAEGAATLLEALSCCNELEDGCGLFCWC